MVDVSKQTQEFIDEYGCSYLHARQAALLSKDLCEAVSPENLSVNIVLEKWKLQKASVSVQILKACAIAVLLFTDYPKKKQSGKIHDESTLPNLVADIYPIVALVMEKPRKYIRIYIRTLLKNFPAQMSVKELVFALVDEALKFM